MERNPVWGGCHLLRLFTQEPAKKTRICLLGRHICVYDWWEAIETVLRKANRYFFRRSAESPARLPGFWHSLWGRLH